MEEMYVYCYSRDSEEDLYYSEEVVLRGGCARVIACITCALETYVRPRNPVNPLSQHFLQNGTLAFARLRVFSVVHTWTYKQSRDSKVLARLNTSQSNFLSQLRYLITL